MGIVLVPHIFSLDKECCLADAVAPVRSTGVPTFASLPSLQLAFIPIFRRKLSSPLRQRFTIVLSSVGHGPKIGSGVSNEDNYERSKATRETLESLVSDEMQVLLYKDP